MAVWQEFGEIERAEWARWLSEHGPVRALAERFPPWKLYRLKTSHGGKQRVFPIAYDENGTLRVAVSAEFNLLGFERSVFGVEPEDLAECDLPEDGEVVGTAHLSIEDAKAILDKRTTFGEAVAEKAVDVSYFRRADWPKKGRPS